MTMEAILWFPLLFFILVSVCDLSIFYMNKARIDKIVAEGVRGYAVGAFDDCDETEDWLEDKVGIIAPNVSVSCSEDGAIATAEVTFPASDVTLTGRTGLLRSMTMKVNRFHLTERL